MKAKFTEKIKKVENELKDIEAARANTNSEADRANVASSIIKCEGLRSMLEIMAHRLSRFDPSIYQCVNEFSESAYNFRLSL